MCVAYPTKIPNQNQTDYIHVHDLAIVEKKSLPLSGVAPTRPPEFPTK